MICRVETVAGEGVIERATESGFRNGVESPPWRVVLTCRAGGENGVGGLELLSGNTKFYGLQWGGKVVISPKTSSS